MSQKETIRGGQNEGQSRGSLSSSDGPSRANSLSGFNPNHLASTNVQSDPSSVSHDQCISFSLVHVAPLAQVEDEAEPGLLFPDDVLPVQRNLLRPGELRQKVLFAVWLLQANLASEGR